MPSSTTRPSTWWKTGLCVASNSSVRKTRPGQIDVDRRRAGQHGAGLHRRGVGAQHQVVLGGVGPERVLHGAGRVVGAEVEGVEVEPLRLEDRTLGDLPAHRDEDVGDQLGAGGERVPRAGGDPVGRQRDVDGLLDQHPLLVLGLELLLPLRERLLHRAARLADALAGLLARLRRQRPDLAVGQRQRRPVAGVLDPDLLQRLEVGGARDRGERGVARGLDLLGLQRGHLHGVEVGVRSGHGGESRNRPVGARPG